MGAASATVNSRCTGAAAMPAWNSGRSQRTVPAKLLLGALAVQGGEAGEKIIVGDLGGPAIGGEDGTVEIVVQPPDHADEAAVVNAALGFGQRPRRSAISPARYRARSKSGRDRAAAAPCAARPIPRQSPRSPPARPRRNPETETGRSIAIWCNVGRSSKRSHRAPKSSRRACGLRIPRVRMHIRRRCEDEHVVGQNASIEGK